MTLTRLVTQSATGWRIFRRRASVGGHPAAAVPAAARLPGPAARLRVRQRLAHCHAQRFTEFRHAFPRSANSCLAI
jgi:hypothetical protein